jgi:hypothetical protein
MTIGLQKSDRQDGIFSRSDFRWDRKRGVYLCPNGKLLRTSGTLHDGRTLLYRASKLKPRDGLESRAIPWLRSSSKAELPPVATAGLFSNR